MGFADGAQVFVTEAADGNRDRKRPVTSVENRGIDFPNSDREALMENRSCVTPICQISRSPWHQLLVIGNGFDLACGLKSRFVDFGSAREEYFSCSAEASEGAHPRKFTKTVWDLILDSRGGESWADIEGSISSWVAPKSTLRGFDGVREQLKNHRLDHGFDTHVFQREAGVAEYLLEKYGSAAYDWDTGQLVDVARSDLGTLEQDFASYLQAEVNSSHEYEKNAQRLLRSLLVDECPIGGEYHIKGSVLSFNYTRPIQQSEFAGCSISYVNVHGRLDSEIVFGIDGSGRMRAQSVVPFTKTYRLMALDLPDMGTLVRPPCKEGDCTRIIKFYGHSLARADYSYFQAIFDAIDLYGGKTRLVFYYRPHGGKRQDAAQQRMMRKAIRLLSAYGNTLDNRAHGRNLIHKLLIEGRLSVKLLKDAQNSK